MQYFLLFRLSLGIEEDWDFSQSNYKKRAFNNYILISLNQKQRFRYKIMVLQELKQRQQHYIIQRIFMNVQKSACEVKQPVLCQSCQSFYGTQNTQWLCSSCYKKGNRQKKIEVISEGVQEDGKEQSLVKQETPQEEKKDIFQVDRKRCFSCKKKVGLLGVECKCKYIFCNNHRMPQDHSCEFDFKSNGLKELEKTVIKVEHAKITQV